MFLPPTIDLGTSEKYILSLRIKSTEFLFSLTEPNAGKNYCLRGTQFAQNKESLLENIQKIVFELNFLTQQYARTNVVFVSPDYSLVPSEFYETKEKNELFEFSSHQKGEFVLTNEIPKYGINTLYSVDEELYDFLARSLYNPQFSHHTTPLIHLLEGRSKSTSLHAKLYVNIHDNVLDLLCFSESKLLLAQTYESLTDSETIYYILKVWESLELNQMRDQLLIAGGLEEDVLVVLRDYVKNIERLSSPSEIYLWHKDAQKAPLDLISLSL